VRQPDLTTPKADLHDDLAKSTLTTEQPVAQPDLRRTDPHPVQDTRSLCRLLAAPPIVTVHVRSVLW
jgi:hypothetical protein